VGDMVFGHYVAFGNMLNYDPSLPQGFMNFTFGVLDSVSLNLSKAVRTAMGNSDSVDECSTLYAAGGWVGVAFDLLTGGGLIKGGLKGLRALKGLGRQNPLYKAAVQRFKNTDFSNAGRALTKHPEVIGHTKDTLRQVLRTSREINNAAHSALRGIIRNGLTTAPRLGRYGRVTQIQIPGGFGARWAPDGSFIGFINP
jgi:hypothetical protein